MKYLSILSLILILVSIFLINCASKSKEKSHDPSVFQAELKELKKYFKIPGLAAIIEQDGQIIYEDYLGFANLATQSPVDSNTLFPIASLTKSFAAVLILKLVESGKVSLEEPINNYLTQTKLPDAIKVKHILSHTSQGEIGQQFYYSSRFGLLTKVIEKASGQTYAEFMAQEIFQPIGLQSSFLLKDSIQVLESGARFAIPYFLADKTEKGFIDYGYSSSAGIVSTAKDLLKFSNALDQNSLISAASKQQMYTRFKDDLAYAFGIFNQTIEGVDIVWSYGQYDCYSSLFVKIPSQKISLILFANNNLMSDPARLIYGDLSSSLFAMSFLKNYVFQFTEMPLLEKTDTSFPIVSNKSNFHRKKILAQALAESFLARFDSDKLMTSANLLDHCFKNYPDYLNYADKTLLHNLIFLKDVAFHKSLGKFEKFDEQIEKIGARLLEENTNDPYIRSYLASFADRKGNEAQAKLHYKSIIEAENFSPNWYTREAQAWLKER